MLELDDSEALERTDRSGMLRLISSSPELLLEGLDYDWSIEPEAFEPLSRAVLVGYGGSAISGDVLRDRFLRESGVDISVCRDLRLPGYVDEETLLVCASYSGNTGESLMMLEEAMEADLNIAALTSGGAMAKFCERFRIPLMRVRGGLPPRAALPLQLSALAKVLSSFGLIADMSREICRAAEELREQVSRVRPEVSSGSNPAKNLALELLDSIPAVYSLERMSSVARRLKDQFNENSKIPARYDLVPEACHNEIEGWTGDWSSSTSAYRFIGLIVRDNMESPHESARMDLLRDQLELVGLKMHEIRAGGETGLGRLLLPINLGDFASAYLALARGLDPTPITAIEGFKRIVEARTLEMDRLTGILKD
ncbi:bifunctional phosphoglucose/phosphomannose isomerase [Candidatus Bathyarchaeota archaeon]|nr:bifunctional phosphoglucose/phosphomannose isomerase [Candidatus Bathyarchaeota archaeon]